MTSSGNVGWYVEIPKPLMDRFNALKLPKGAKAKLTIAMIKYVVETMGGAGDE